MFLAGIHLRFVISHINLVARRRAHEELSPAGTLKPSLMNQPTIASKIRIS